MPRMPRTRLDGRTVCPATASQAWRASHTVRRSTANQARQASRTAQPATSYRARRAGHTARRATANQAWRSSRVFMESRRLTDGILGMAQAAWHTSVQNTPGMATIVTDITTSTIV
jgi:hypothetical protein